MTGEGRSSSKTMDIHVLEKGHSRVRMGQGQVARNAAPPHKEPPNKVLSRGHGR